MKVFQVSTQIHQCTSCEAFIEAFPITQKDFILASETTYRYYFEKFKLPACIRYKSQYGQGEPTSQMMDELLKDFRQTGCERIIAIGGGAVIDMAKILVLKGNATTKEIFEKEVSLEKEKTLIVVPTTCGSGSEVSGVAIATFSHLHEKYGLATDEIIPDVAALIPELLTSLPYTAFVASVIDALIHAVESFLSPKSNMYTELFSVRGIEIIVKGLKNIAEKGKESRMKQLESFLVASNYAGIAFSNTGTGAVHAISYPLSGEYHVNHGEANCLFFIAVMQMYDRKKAKGKIQELKSLLTEIMNCEEMSVWEVLGDMLDQVFIRKSLESYGMKKEEILDFSKNVIHSQQRLLSNSYVPLDIQDIQTIYKQLF